MPPDVELGSQTILVEADWTFQEFLNIGKTYIQLYSLLYPLQPELEPSLRADGQERLEYLYRAFPWRGGYSAVNFYQAQFYLVPPASRSSIRRIHIESPGFIELGVAVAAAYSVQHLVKSISRSAGYVHNLYHDIYRQMHERKLMRISARREEIALAKEQLAFAAGAQAELASAMELRETERIRSLADNPLAALKITLSLYRRTRVLSKAEEQEKLEIEPPAT